MVNIIKSLLLGLLVCSSAFAQIDITTVKAKSLTGVTGARSIGDVILLPIDSKPVFSEVAIVTVESPAKFIRVRAYKSIFETATVTRLDEKNYMLSGLPGRYAVEVTAFDPTSGIEEKSIEVVLGSSPNPDPKPDDPPVPQPVKSFRVIFVRESGTTLPGSQTAITGAKSVRDYLTAKTTPEGGLAGWREYDPNQNIANEQSAMKSLWAAAKSSISKVPCVVVELNGKVSVIDYPQNTTEAIKTLKEYGGQ